MQNESQDIGAYKQQVDSETFENVDIDEAKLIAKVCNDYENDKASRQVWERNKEYIYKRYRQQSVRVPPFDGGADIVVPVLQQNLDALQPRCSNAFLASRPYVVFTGIEENDKKPARRIEKFYNICLEKRTDYPKMIDQMTFNDCLLGTDFIKDLYDLKSKQPKLVGVNVEDIFIPYNIQCDLNDYPHLIHRYYKSRHYVSTRYQIPIDELSNQNYYPEGLARTKILIEGRINNDRPEDQPRELLEWHGQWEVGDDMRDVVVIVDYYARKLCARWYLTEVVPYAKDQEGNYIRRIPFSVGFFKPVFGCAYGSGLGDDLKGTHDWMNATANQIVDATNWSIIPWGVYRASSNVEVENLKMQFGKFVGLDDINDLRFMNVSNNAQNAINMLPFIQATVERTSALSDYSQGRESETLGTSATWRGTQAVLQEMMIRIDSYIKRRCNALKYSLENYYMWLQEMTTEYDITRTLGITDPEDLRMFKDALSLKYDLMVNVNYGYWNRDAERENATNLLKLFAQDPDIMSNPKLRIELKKKLLNALDMEKYAELLDVENAASYEQQEENAKMIQGDPVETNMTDDHQKHRQEIERLMSQKMWRKLPMDAKNLITNHYQSHEQMFMALQQQFMQMKQAEMAARGMMPPPQAGGGMPPNAPQMPQNGANAPEGIPPSTEMGGDVPVQQMAEGEMNPYQPPQDINAGLPQA